eukprot:CAMPEP_0206461544 /NCGR_PEP_ID=MMETSP0324_2-20121206/25433_1 /ASSEMBLY_ACC=CAM_ASM_000836 /TAXON_ID=2866 /ORGANISM="Crypthecodinium cohnii, Strain Seligo" /LENGTH=252 /DNA_ID=CAMNT_0053933503 /DNA_START=205 /DNA_END=963 /DNA_ORIENTATION=-
MAVREAMPLRHVVLLLFFTVNVALAVNLGVNDYERQMRREPLPIYRREHDKVHPDYVESRSSTVPSPAQSAEAPRPTSKATPMGSLLSEDLWHGEDTHEMLMGQHLYRFDLERLINSESVSGNPSPAPGGVRTVTPQEKSAVYKETETYQKVVKEAERESGLPDTVDTTTTSAVDNDTDESQENAIAGVVVIFLLSVLVFSLVWSQRKQDKAQRVHEGLEKEEEDPHEAHEADGAAPAEDPSAGEPEGVAAS